MLDRECSFSNEVSVQMLQLHTMAIKMAELVKKYPRSKRVELAGYMTRYDGGVALLYTDHSVYLLSFRSS